MNETPHTPGSVRNDSDKPPGVLPKHAQAWVLGGIALVMVLVIAFTGGKPPKSSNVRTVPLTAASPDEARIQEYRVRIEQQVQKLAAEQAKVAQARQTLNDLPVPGPDAPRAGVSTVPGAASAESPALREKDWITLDREKREYQSRYSSNVAFTRRPEPTPHTTPSVGTAGMPADADAARGASPAKIAPELQESTGKLYRLFEGTIVETVLTNRLDGSFSGPIDCLVTTNVFSHDRLHLLIPQGTRALGTVSRVETQGQHRLAVAFHRLIMPDGYSVNLDKLPGLSQQGETGLLDQINHHYLQVFGVSLAIGAIGGLSAMNTDYGVNASAADVYRQGVASSLSQTSLNILDRYLNVMPTFTIREGHRVKVYLTGDLQLPAYDHHQLPHDL